MARFPVRSHKWQNKAADGVMRNIGRAAVLAAAMFLGSCVHVPPPGVGEAVPWYRLTGWQDEHPAQAWPALQQSCKALATREPVWKIICADAASIIDPDDAVARAFFESHFTPHVLYGDEGATDGLVTGYYEPLLRGSRFRTERFRYPIYARPDDLLTIDLGEVYPELKGKRLRGRVDGKRVVPYYSRTQIENGKRMPSQPLAWVDDPIALFFLHVQGSGRVELPDGKIVYLGYVDQNGHPYRSVGRRLVDEGVMKLEDVSMQSMRAWFAANPDKANAMLNTNPSYIFFEERESGIAGPLGALKVPLIAERAIAVDPSFVTLGLPVWLETTLPDEAATPYRRLVFAQDTGGAIKGPVRADMFFGFGDRAEELAGRMKQRGRLYVLLPNADLNAVAR